MTDKKTSAIAATSLAAVLGLYGGMQLTNVMETKNYDPMGITIPPIVLETMCISTSDNFNELSELKTASGENVFTCDEMIKFKEFGGTLEYARELASIKDFQGKPFFTGYDIVAFKQVGGTAEYARKFVSALNSDGRPFSGSQLPQFYKLGLELQEIVAFIDTPKPNALIIYPAHDGKLLFGSKTYGAFRADYGLDLYNKLREAYDIKVNVSSTEDEVYDALSASNGFMFFMIVGHGTEKTLSLGENDPGIANAEKDEKYALDTSDNELEQYLQYLDSLATIFLNSCSTGKGGLGADNLANAVAGWANGREVIAAKEELWNNRITNVHPYPFDATLLNESGEKDITYRVLVDP